MRHFERGGKFYFVARAGVLAVSGVAAVASLGAVYILTPPAGVHGQASSNSLLLTQASSAQPKADGVAQEVLSEFNGEADNNTSTTKITINGHDIPVPSQGNVRQSLPSGNGQTTVDISVDHTRTMNQGSSSTRLNISSQSSSYAESVDYDEHSPPL